MNTLANSQIQASYSDGYIFVYMESGVEIKFPVEKNPRLKQGTPEQLNHIEISPFGLHWPDLDEDLSFEGLSRGDFGQFSKV
ncbi:DUF2442 domain-containing protein [Puniceicoccus vermicola]|uniref:DUF2442 domain-containing protein n=1 Tax=Puniceicoccus vermicola TaxID=388746 RepID=A0A7X1B0U4_9BACT|nr:DUF2442 domain-containing protein [Puniceicoccus vermicola]MBC2603548.1 DUF2442 domain-containing protein [Puniceicoccus vermicola]